MRVHACVRACVWVCNCSCTIHTVCTKTVHTHVHRTAHTLEILVNLLLFERHRLSPGPKYRGRKENHSMWDSLGGLQEQQGDYRDSLGDYRNSRGTTGTA